MQIRCERGAAIARRIGFPEATAQAIRSLDEHWCGLGHPEGLRGDAIPLLARICLLAQTLEIFHARDGVRVAIRVVSRRSGTWFDPALVRIVRRWKGDAAWWASLHAPGCAARVHALEPPALARRAGPPELDRVAEAFADIIDTKSPFTFRHSTHVALLARGTARVLGLHADEVRQIWRAGLLHDIGKLGVSNRILDKPGKLDPRERAEVERHPAYTWEILSRVDAFADFAFAAATHHEKLDGGGYPWGLRGAQLDRASRILAVADIYEAITADRPYRAGMCHDAAMTILEKDRGVKYDADAVDALGVFVEGSSWSAND